MRVKFFVLAALVLGLWSRADAGMRPSFSPEYSAWHATEIVVATEGETIDGHFTILENLKGELFVSQVVEVPELALFHSEESRLIRETGFDENPNPPKYVSGAKMILFLKKDEKSGEWKSTALFGGMNVSVVWLENNESFGFRQIENPGPSILVPLYISETKMREKILEITGIQNSYNEALKIKNKAERAEALEPFFGADAHFIRFLALAEIEKCGASALPVLRKMLAREDLLRVHGNLIELMVRLGGQKSGGELVRIVNEELKFWKQTAPKLGKNWWTDVDDDGTMALQTRFLKLLQAVRQLKNLKFAPSRKAVAELRVFWRSLPQLEDKDRSGLLSVECDELLAALDRK